MLIVIGQDLPQFTLLMQVKASVQKQDGFYHRSQEQPEGVENDHLHKKYTINNTINIKIKAVMNKNFFFFAIFRFISLNHFQAQFL